MVIAVAVWSVLKAHAKLAFEQGVEIARSWKKSKRRGQLTLGAIGGIIGTILVIYVLLLVIGKFHPVITQNIQEANDTIAKQMLTDVDSNTQSSP